MRECLLSILTNLNDQCEIGNYYFGLDMNRININELNNWLISTESNQRLSIQDINQSDNHVLFLFDKLYIDTYDNTILTCSNIGENIQNFIDRNRNIDDFLL